MNSLLPVALSRTLQSLGESKVWHYLLLPIILAGASWLLLTLFYLDWFVSRLMENPPLSFLVTWGLIWLAKIVAVMSGWLGIFSIAYLLALLFATTLILPLLLRHLAANEYRDVIPAGQVGFLRSGLYSVSMVALFLLLNIVLLPLWLIPGMAAVIPVLTLAWLNYKTCPFDVLCDFATNSELAEIRTRYGRSFFFLGLLCAFFAYVPFISPFVPALTVLVYAHYALESLRRLRADAVISVEATNCVDAEQEAPQNAGALMAAHPHH